ncbi:MAG: hypothetical protein K2Z80_24510 [Xanthobacteraceae bacterium]|nr:hypothetical protein [Xanthobacteraceae bacterium]
MMTEAKPFGVPARIVRGWFVGLSILLAAFHARTAAQAQTYCAMYDNGSKSCGIPSLDGCRQSVDGVGGYCIPDQTSQMRPDLIDPLRRPMPTPDALSPSPDSSPGDLDWMPPPPEL